MDVRKIKTKVSTGFKMRGLILRPYVYVMFIPYVCVWGSELALMDTRRKSRHLNIVDNLLLIYVHKILHGALLLSDANGPFNFIQLIIMSILSD